MATLKLVRTGESSYIKLNAEDYKAWKAAGNKEYGADDAPAAEMQEKPRTEDAIAARAVGAPEENKQRRGPAEKKQG